MFIHAIKCIRFLGFNSLDGKLNSYIECPGEILSCFSIDILPHKTYLVFIYIKIIPSLPSTCCVQNEIILTTIETEFVYI